MIQNQATSSEQFKDDRSSEFPGKRWSSNLQFDPMRYSWLAYEQTWQTIAYTRLYQSCSSASLELTTDLANAISGQIAQIENLAIEYKSISLESLSTLRSRIIQPRKLCVTFPTDA